MCLDYHNWHCRITLQEIFDVCAADGLDGMTFIVDRELQQHGIHSGILRHVHNMGHRISDLAGRVSGRLTNGRIQWEDLVFCHSIPDNCRLEFATRTDWLEGGDWATSLDEPLFHYRGSLTDALNYLSFTYPGSPIKLLGVDLKAGYFFQQEPGTLGKFSDWAEQVEKATGLHSTAADYQGKSVLDKLGFILECLDKTGNQLFCCNPKSLLVERGLVPYRAVVEST
jgi:hypothetical protein